GGTLTGVSLGTDGTLYAGANGDFKVWWSTNNGQSWAAMLSAQSYTLPVGSTDNLWAMDADHNVFFSNAPDNWRQVAAPEQATAQVAVGFDGSVFLLGQNDLWQYVDQQWQKVCPAGNFMNISVVGAANIWAIVATSSDTYGIQQYTNGQWQSVPSPLGA